MARRAVAGAGLGEEWMSGSARSTASEGNRASGVFGPWRNLERVGASEQVVDQALVRPAGDTAEQDGVVVIDENLEILPRLQVQSLPHRTGQDDLTLFSRER